MPTGTYAIIPNSLSTNTKSRTYNAEDNRKTQPRFCRDQCSCKLNQTISQHTIIISRVTLTGIDGGIYSFLMCKQSHVVIPHADIKGIITHVHSQATSAMGQNKPACPGHSLTSRNTATNKKDPWSHSASGANVMHHPRPRNVEKIVVFGGPVTLRSQAQPTVRTSPRAAQPAILIQRIPESRIYSESNDASCEGPPSSAVRLTSAQQRNA